MARLVSTNYAIVLTATVEEYTARKIVLTRGIKTDLNMTRAVFIAVADPKTVGRYQVYSITDLTYKPRGVAKQRNDVDVDKNVLTWKKDGFAFLTFSAEDTPKYSLHYLVQLAHQRAKSNRGYAFGQPSLKLDNDFVVTILSAEKPVTRHISSIGAVSRSHEVCDLIQQRQTLADLDRIIDKLGPNSILTYMLTNKRFAAKQSAALYRAIAEYKTLTAEDNEAKEKLPALQLSELTQDVINVAYATDRCQALAEEVAIIFDLRNDDSVWMNIPKPNEACLRLMILPRRRNARYAEIILCSVFVEGVLTWKISAKSPTDITPSLVLSDKKDAQEIRELVRGFASDTITA